MEESKENYDLTPRVAPNLDRHLVFPILEFLQERRLYPDEQILKFTIELLNKTNMVDYAMDKHKSLYHTEDAPQDMVERRAEVVARLKSLEEAAAPLVTVLVNPDAVKELRADKQYNLQMLKERYQIGPDQIEALYQYAKFQFECGNYYGAAEYLYQYRILCSNPERSLSALWGLLASDILMQKWDIALEELNRLKEIIDSKSFASPLNEVQNRIWLMHWGLYIFFNHDNGRTQLIDLFNQDKYMNAIRTSAPHLLRYLATAFIVKRSSTQLKEFIKLIQHYSYKDPIVEFLACVFVNCDFDGAQKKMKECEEVIVNDLFLGLRVKDGNFSTVPLRDEFLENARQFILETYCRIHQRFYLGELGVKLNLNCAEAERWIVNRIHTLKLDAKIDGESGTVIMEPTHPNVHNRLLERARLLEYTRGEQLDNVVIAVDESGGSDESYLERGFESHLESDFESHLESDFESHLESNFENHSHESDYDEGYEWVGDTDQRDVHVNKMLMVHLLRIACCSDNVLSKESLIPLIEELSELGLIPADLKVVASDPVGDFYLSLKKLHQRRGRRTRFCNFWDEPSIKGPYNDFIEIKSIGHGAFGSVMLCKHKLDETMYAVKKIAMVTKKNKPLKSVEVIREVKALSRLQHEHIVRYSQAWLEYAYRDVKSSSESEYSETSSSVETVTSERVKHLFIQMEYCNNTLKNLLQGNDKGKLEFSYELNEEKAMRIMCQITEGLAHVHGKGMIHRDIKPDNIFLDSSDNVKIGDFGLAILNLESFECGDEGGTKSEPKGTHLYMAPEVKEKLSYDQKADMYSLGVVFFELWYPFGSATERVAVLSRLKEEEQPPEQWKIDYPGHAMLLRRLLSLDPVKRPSATDLLKILEDGLISVQEMA